MPQPTKRNRLADEPSPYLQQHADNPVHWQPWGEAAFERAQAHDVPVFVSIGYSSCHWCHVMEEESFADEDVAALLNESFVPIKVDREERPDVDSTFMTVCQLVTGGGGWPLSAWCTPEGKPFYVGTYFPPDPRGNTPSFTGLCERIAASWSDDEQRTQMVERAEQWSSSARDELESVPAGAADPPDATLLDETAAAAMRGVDQEHGGFGSSGPKFPMPGRVDLLLRSGARTGRRELVAAATKTLDGMASGGMYDQVGGGFHRYAVDRSWTIPHFEKMLYDNAELPMVYLDGYQLTGDPAYARIAGESLRFLERELRHPHGGFFSTLDARSQQPSTRSGDPDERVEGAFYAWTPAEVDATLDGDAASMAQQRYGIESGGNFERGTTVPTLSASIDRVAANHDQAVDEVAETLVEARATLFEARETRPRPARDEKVLASWNGRAISAFARAGQTLGAPYDDIAADALRFCRDRLYDAESGRLDRRWLDGDVAGPGYLDDYAFLARAGFDVHAATGDLEPLAFALEVAAAMVDAFYEPDDGTIYFTRKAGDDGSDDTGSDDTAGTDAPGDAGTLFARPQEFTDRSTPSSLGVAAETLLILDAFRSDDRFRSIAEDVLSTHADRIRSSPLEHVSLVRAATRLATGTVEVTVAAETVPSAWRDALGERYLPGHVLTRRPPTADGLDAWLDRLEVDAAPPIWKGRDATAGEPTMYVCEGFTCSPPQTTVDDALDWLDGRR